MVGMVLSIGREMDGWSDLGCGGLGGGICLQVSTFKVSGKDIDAKDLLHFVGIDMEIQMCAL